ncbi:MAG: leucine-rich repeat domain-containing protein [Chitinivibrionales bacterium]|nr:leucine-rich repeat domain-containing protein [Chitinivibrionales bacterium]
MTTRRLLYCILFLSCSVIRDVLAQSHDTDVVRLILSNNNLDWEVSKCTILEDGRVIKLDFKNRSPTQKGIEKLSPEIEQLTELRELVLNDNSLQELPLQLWNCTKLSHLEIRDNYIRSLPKEISQCQNLEILDLRSNQLDSLPSEIGNLKALKILKLWSNNLQTLPVSIGELSSLQELYLRFNKLTYLPESITNLQLTYLDIMDNQLCTISGLTDLWLKKYNSDYQNMQRCEGLMKRFN